MSRQKRLRRRKKKINWNQEDIFSWYGKHSWDGRFCSD